MLEPETNTKDIRHFNRFYVDTLGLLRSVSYYGSYSLTETRILFEIHQAKSIQASHIMALIEIDKSYLSRILRKLEKEGLITRTPSELDARALLVELTQKGHSEFSKIDQASTDHIDSLIKNLGVAQRQDLVSHMKAIMTLLKDSKHHDR